MDLPAEKTFKEFMSYCFLTRIHNKLFRLNSTNSNTHLRFSADKARFEQGKNPPLKKVNKEIKTRSSIVADV